MAFLQGALEREKRGALHEKQRKRRKSEVRYRDVAAASLPGRPESLRTPRAIQKETKAKASSQWWNHFSADLGTPKMRPFATFRIAGPVDTLIANSPNRCYVSRIRPCGLP